MKHLGDITKISGYDAPIVDCIIGGSPCLWASEIEEFPIAVTEKRINNEDRTY